MDTHFLTCPGCQSVHDCNGETKNPLHCARNAENLPYRHYYWAFLDEHAQTEEIKFSNPSCLWNKCSICGLSEGDHFGSENYCCISYCCECRLKKCGWPRELYNTHGCEFCKNRPAYIQQLEKDKVARAIEEAAEKRRDEEIAMKKKAEAAAREASASKKKEDEEKAAAAAAAEKRIEEEIAMRIEAEAAAKTASASKKKEDEERAAAAAKAERDSIKSMLRARGVQDREGIISVKLHSVGVRSLKGLQGLDEVHLEELPRPEREELDTLLVSLKNSNESRHSISCANLLDLIDRLLNLPWFRSKNLDKAHLTSNDIRSYILAGNPHPAEHFPELFSSLPPNVALTYEWRLTFEDILTFLNPRSLDLVNEKRKASIPTKLTDLHIWIDVLFVDQTTKDIQAALVEAEQVYKLADYHLALATRTVYTRGWCLFEFAVRRLAEKETYLVMSLSARDREDLNLDLFMKETDGRLYENMHATDPADLVRIRSKLCDAFGSSKNFNDAMYNKLISFWGSK